MIEPQSREHPSTIGLNHARDREDERNIGMVERNSTRAPTTVSTGPPAGAAKRPFRSRLVEWFTAKDLPWRSAAAYFEFVHAEFRSTQAAKDLEGYPEAKALADDLASKYDTDKSSLKLTDVVMFEKMLTALLPEDALRRKASQLRDRFRKCVEPQEYQLYLETVPPDAATGDINKLRVDLLDLLDRMLWIYTIAPFREDMRSRISSRISVIFLAFITFIISIYIIYYEINILNHQSPVIPTLLVVVVVGMIGGVVSVQQRIQSTPTEGDAIRNVLSLSSGLFSVYMSPITGAVSATLLYLLFAGGLLTGALFPDMTNNPEKLEFLFSFEHATSAHFPNFARLIIWSFIAGFAERFVPDTLNRLVSAAQSSSQSKPTAVLVSPNPPGEDRGASAQAEVGKPGSGQASGKDHA
jgi:hypothetical protein